MRLFFENVTKTGSTEIDEKFIFIVNQSWTAAGELQFLDYSHSLHSLTSPVPYASWNLLILNVMIGGSFLLFVLIFQLLNLVLAALSIAELVKFVTTDDTEIVYYVKFAVFSATYVSTFLVSIDMITVIYFRLHLLNCFKQNHIRGEWCNFLWHNSIADPGFQNLRRVQGEGSQF